jgi:type II secretion system protein G
VIEIYRNCNQSEFHFCGIELAVGQRSQKSGKGGRMKIRLKKKGFTLIELLIVVAIIGIIAAIAIPNLLNAIQRGKQKRTMADMRAIGTAVESYAVDNNHYPGGASAVSNIAAVVQPRYIARLPMRDAWQTEFDFRSSPAGNAQNYTIQSYGKNQTTEATPAGSTTDFNNDIIFSQGVFTTFPEGSQK